MLLRFVHIGHCHPLSGEKGTEPLAKGLLFFIEEMAHGFAVPRAIATEEFLAATGIVEARNVVLLIFIEQAHLLCRGRIHFHEGRFVAPEVGGGVDVAVVGREEEEIHRLLEVCGKHGTEGLVVRVAIEQLRIHAVHNGGDGADMPVMVGEPPLIVSRIFGQERQFSGFEIKAIGVERFGVAPVHLYQHLIGHVLQIVENAGAHALEWRVANFIAAVDADAVEAVVLIARRVFRKEQAVVARPHIALYAPLCLEGELARQGFAVYGNDKKVHPILVGRHVRDVPPVGRNLIGCRWRVSEKLFYGILFHILYIGEFCLLPPVFFRRKTDLRLNKFAKEGSIGEIIFFGYFFNGARGIAQALLDVFNSKIVNPHKRGLAACHLYGRRKILGRNAKFLGVKYHGPVVAAVLLQ